MAKTHATRTVLDRSGQKSELWRTAGLPLAGGLLLLLLFFSLLFTAPNGPTEPTEVATEPAPAAVAAVSTNTSTCPIPAAVGEAGLVSAKFAGRKTSSGRVYDPNEATCIINMKSSLGKLAYGTRLALKSRALQSKVTCEVVGRFNGEKNQERLVLVSKRTAELLSFGSRGLIQVETGCPDETHAELKPR